MALALFVRQLGLAEPLDDVGVVFGRGCQIEEVVAVNAPLVVEAVQELAQRLISGQIVELRLVIEQALRKGLPDGGVHGTITRKLIDRIFDILAPLLVGKGAARHCDYRESRGKRILQRQVIQRWQELALRQVASRAKDRSEERRVGKECRSRWS